MRTRPIAAVALAGSGWLALAATSLPAGSAARVAVTLVFLLVCPGAALMSALSTLSGDVRHEPLAAATLAVAVSLAAAALVGAVFFLAGGFVLTRCVAVLAGVTTLAALAPAVVGGRSDDLDRRPGRESEGGAL